MMKKHGMTIIIAAFCIFLLLKIASLKNDIADLRNEMNSQIFQVSDEVRNITSNVRVAMEEQNNLLSQQSWEYGAINIENKEVELHFSVFPKEYSPKDTKASLIYNGAEYPMVLEGNKFTVAMNIPLFEDSLIERVIFQENGVVRMQALDMSASPRYDCLPSIGATLYGSFEGTPTGDILTSHREGLIVIDIENKNHKNPIKEVTLVTIMDGKEIERIPVDLSHEAQRAYLKKDSQDGNHYDLPSPSDFANQEYFQLFYYIDKDEDIPFGSTLEWYIEVVDSYGLHYYALCDDVVVTKDGNPEIGEKKWENMGVESNVYDGEGKILYIG